MHTNNNTNESTVAAVTTNNRANRAEIVNDAVNTILAAITGPETPVIGDDETGAQFRARMAAHEMEMADVETARATFRALAVLLAPHMGMTPTATTATATAKPAAKPAGKMRYHVGSANGPIITAKTACALVGIPDSGTADECHARLAAITDTALNAKNVYRTAR